MTPQQSMPRIGDDIEYVIVDGEAVLYDAARGELHRLNPTATRIWERCDGRAAIAAVADRLARGADVERAVVERDVNAYVAELEARGLVTRG